MTVLFRVNGSSSIGIGHVTECITLAHEISFPAVFAINDHPAPKRLMEQEGFPYHVVPGDDKETGSSFQHVIDITKPSLIIFDIPWITQEEVNRLTLGTAKTVFLNALYHPVRGDLHIATVFTPLPENEDYGGLSYVILKQEFTILAPKAVSTKVNNIIVMFGGSDKNGYTLKALEALRGINGGFSVTLIIGVSFMYHDKLKEMLPDYPKKIAVHRNVKDVLPLMKQADLAIVSGGYTAAELCKVGVPLLVLCQTPIEQERIFPQFSDAVINLGLGIDISPDRLRETIIKIMGDYKKREQLVCSGAKLLEGSGAERITHLIRGIL